MITIEEMKIMRFQFLNKLYELSCGDELEMFGMLELGRGLGFDDRTIEKIGQYLEGEGLIKIEAFSSAEEDIITITHRGICEIEEAKTNRDKPTEHFPALNLIYVGQMTNSQIQQASPGASQIAVISEGKYDELKEIINSLKESVDKLELKQQQISEMQIEIQTIELQLSSPKPKNIILTESVNSIIRILEGVASNLIAYGLRAKLIGLL